MRRVSYHPERGFTENGKPVRSCKKCPHPNLEPRWWRFKHRYSGYDRRWSTHNANRVMVLRQVYHDILWTTW